MPFTKRIASVLRQTTGVVLMAALVASCSTSTSQRDGTAAPTGQEALRLSNAGNHEAASRTYLDLALQNSGVQRQRYLIFAAGELYLANDLEGAERILGQVGTDVAETNLELWAQVAAEVRLAQGNPTAALAALNKVTSTQSPESASRILLMRSEAYFMLQRPDSGVRVLLKREGFLNDRAAIENNHRQIWSGLQTTGPRIPENAATFSDDAILNGWLELGLVAYDNRASFSSLSMSLKQWRAENPSHPASGALLQEVLEGLQTMANYPGRAAVLLPLSGKQKALGEAIRDGYLAAHFSLGEDARTDIRFYDTAVGGVAAAYQQAALNGTDFFVGPLIKNEVAELSALATAEPVLALNFGPEDTEYPELFYQFALAPEDEAREAAIRATDQGQFNAVALVPDSPWGQRVLTAFRTELEERGGKLLASRLYAANTADFADVIRDVLLLDESEARRERLAANIGKQLEFKPRRRQDVDLIFMAANANTAKQIRPQLRFHYAADIPTYATAAVYKPGSTDNNDINGVMFPDMPWLLSPTQMVSYDRSVLEQYWGKGSEQLARFYAMGYDAYHLSGALNSPERNRQLTMPGMTGELYLDDNGQLHRELVWAKIESGKPRTLPATTRGLTQDAIIIVQ